MLSERDYMRDDYKNEKKKTDKKYILNNILFHVYLIKRFFCKNKEDKVS